MNRSDSRALAHIELVHDIKPIEGADNIELIHCLGWTLIAKKQEFKEGQSKINSKVIREGIVCRSYGDGDDYISFKNVSNSYLLKHNG